MNSFIVGRLSKYNYLLFWDATTKSINIWICLNYTNLFLFVWRFTLCLFSLIDFFFSEIIAYWSNYFFQIKKNLCNRRYTLIEQAQKWDQWIINYHHRWRVHIIRSFIFTMFYFYILSNTSLYQWIYNITKHQDYWSCQHDVVYALLCYLFCFIYFSLHSLDSFFLLNIYFTLRFYKREGERKVHVASICSNW
jgi:hypothetical protein